MHALQYIKLNIGFQLQHLWHIHVQSQVRLAHIFSLSWGEGKENVLFCITQNLFFLILFEQHILLFFTCDLQSLNKKEAHFYFVLLLFIYSFQVVYIYVCMYMYTCTIGQWRRNTPSKQSFGGASHWSQTMPAPPPPKPLSLQSVPAPLL